jgi:hypothetical protein
MVLHPCFRMKWIQDHWEKKYVEKAEHHIKNLVRC